MNLFLINEENEISLGVVTHTLTGTNYWSRQFGESKEMRNSRLRAIQEGKPDFVTHELGKTEYDTFFKNSLLKAGYVFYCQVVDIERRIDKDYKRIVNVYGKPGLKVPDKSFNVSNLDVFLKREFVKPTF